MPVIVIQLMLQRVCCLCYTVRYFLPIVNFWKGSAFTEEEASIDGTKIEANANRYTFVRKKAVTKLQARPCFPGAVRRPSREGRLPVRRRASFSL